MVSHLAKPIADNRARICGEIGTFDRSDRTLRRQAADETAPGRANPVFWLPALLSLFLLFGPTVQALEATVDRSRLHVDETLELTLTAPLSGGSSFSLFDLNTLNVTPPDTVALEQDFEILDRQQRYRIQIVQGENTSIITWTLLLQPKRAGALQIPALSFEGNESAPVPLEVLDSKAPGDLAAADVFLQVDTDLQRVWVQQQIFLTVKLYYANDLIRGELAHPDHPDAMFRQLGEQREFSTWQNGRHYKVVERAYAVFPQKAGRLTVPSLEFDGIFMVPRLGRRITRNASSDALEIAVMPPPSGASKPWLPAQSLTLSQTWSPEPARIKVGDSITRRMTLTAAALEGVALPALPVTDVPGFRIYPDRATQETEDHAAGVTGTRQESHTFIAIKPGQYTLPAVEISWWDTVNKTLRTARAPERMITILDRDDALGDPSASSGSTGTPGRMPSFGKPIQGEDSSAVQDPGQPETARTGSDARIDSAGMRHEGAYPDDSTQRSGSDKAGSSAWAWLFGVLWIATGIGWFYHSRRPMANRPVNSSTRLDVEPNWRALRRRFETDPGEAAQWFLSWSRSQRARRPDWIPAIDELEQRLRKDLDQLLAYRYGAPPQFEEDPVALAKRILRAAKASTRSASAPAATGQNDLIPDRFRA